MMEQQINRMPVLGVQTLCHNFPCLPQLRLTRCRTLQTSVPRKHVLNRHDVPANIQYYDSRPSRVLLRMLPFIRKMCNGRMEARFHCSQWDV